MPDLGEGERRVLAPDVQGRADELAGLLLRQVLRVSLESTGEKFVNTIEGVVNMVLFDS